MDLNKALQSVDALVADGKFSEAAESFHAKKSRVHASPTLTITGKEAARKYSEFESQLGEEGEVELIDSYIVDGEPKSVSLYSIKGDPNLDHRLKLLLLVARQWDDAGKIVEEETLQVRSTTEAQPYFPGRKLGNKQVQPRLRLVKPSRKSRGKGGGRPRKPVQDTDLFRIPTIGKTVLEAMNKAGIDTFETLSKAGDDVLDAIRAQSGRRFVNFEPGYWRDAAAHVIAKGFDALPKPPRAKPKKAKRGADLDFSNVAADALDKLPKVGPNMLTALKSEGINTFNDLAEATDEVLEKLRAKGGRPFVNFDMSYFRSAAKAIVDGATKIAAPPKPQSAKASGGRPGRKPKDINPNDLHILTGVGKGLIQSLHDRGINTFEDLANADKAVIEDARAQTKGKYKNINVAYLQRQARHAANGNFDKLSSEVKLDKAAPAAKADLAERRLARLKNAKKQDLDVLPGIGKSVKEAMNAAGINTFAQLASAKVERLQEIAQNAGKRFARFDVNFWKDVAQKAHAEDFENIPAKPPVAEKPKRTPRADGKRAPRQARPPRTPRDNKDLGALPSIGKTIINALHEANIKTFAQLASASDAKLEAVRANSGPKYKTFPVEYWKQVAELAKNETYEYPPVPVKEKKASTGRRGRAKKGKQPTDLRALAGVGANLEASLRDNDIKTWQDIVDAEPWVLGKAGAEAGKRTRNLDTAALKRAARDAMAGKFPEPVKRARKSTPMPEGADKLKMLPGIGAGVQDKLFERGIMTYNDLGNANIATLEAVRDEVGRRVAKADVREWRRMGKLAADGEWSKIDPAKYGDDGKPTTKAAPRPKPAKNGDDLTKIKGIGPQAAQLFASRGVKTYLQVVQLSDDALIALIEEGSARIDPADFEKVRSAAAKLAGAAPSKKVEDSTDKPSAKTSTKASKKRKTTRSTKKKGK